MQRNKSNGVFKRAFRRFKTRRYNSYKPRISLTQITNNKTLFAKIENYDTIIMVNGTSKPLFQGTNQNYLPFKDIFTNNSGFQAEYGTWSRYKIIGCSIEFVPCMDLAFARANFSLAAPGIACAAYADRTSNDRGDEPKDNDNVLVAYVAVQYPQRKYWKFNDGFIDSSGSGVGTWNKSYGYNNQEGQFSICNLEAGNQVTGTHNFFNVKATLYLIYSTKTK